MRQIGIVGAGATGTLAAIRILEKYADLGVVVTLFDRNSKPGRGLAYCDDDSSLLLNVTAEKMGILDFIKAHYPEALNSKHYPYVERKYFRLYLEHKVKLLPAAQIRFISEEVKNLNFNNTQWCVQTTNVKVYNFDALIIATGYKKRKTRYLGAIDAFDYDSIRSVSPDARVLILGSGLTAIDSCRLLFKLNPDRPQVDFVSRRGTFPITHKDYSKSKKGYQYVGQSPSSILKNYRAAVSAGMSTVEIGDELRSQATSIWAAWSHLERKQFVIHLKPYWDRLRHRVPETVMDEIQIEMTRGKVALFKGNIEKTECIDGKQLVQIKEGRGQANQLKSYDVIIDATGVQIEDHVGSTDWKSLNIRKSPLGLGLENEASPYLWILGPASRTEGWEVVAIPEITLQIDRMIGQINEKVNQPEIREFERFRVHPSTAHETYFEHLKRASKMGLFFCKLGMISFTHAFMNSFFTDAATDGVRKFEVKSRQIRMKRFKIKK